MLGSRPVFKLPGELLSRRRVELDSITAHFALGGVRVIERETGTLERIKARATALSPLAVIQRGYSITFSKETGAVVRSPADVDLGAPLRIKLANGDLDAEVTGKE